MIDLKVVFVGGLVICLIAYSMGYNRGYKHCERVAAIERALNERETP